MTVLSGRTALVTGGSRGIGREIAVALAQAGADVAIVYRSAAAETKAVVEEIRRSGRRAEAFPADLAQPAAAKQVVKAVEQAFGTIDVLVNCAGINPTRSIEAITAEDWDKTISVNLSSVFHVTQAALPAMREQQWGRIIILSSIAAQTGGVIGPHYAASKAGLHGLMHSYARNLAKEGITCNVIAPALVETEMLKSNDTIKPDLIPIGRFGQPCEIATIAVMLATNGYVTGQTINANGGWYMS